jgi:hypothetical protein
MRIAVNEEGAVPGFTLTAEMRRDMALSVAARAAHAEGFEVQHLYEWEFVARRSSLTMSWLMGPFVTYCNFRVSVLEHRQGVQVVVQRNVPWWTGLSGLRGVRSWALKLANAIDGALEAGGGKVLDRQEF